MANFFELYNKQDIVSQRLLQLYAVCYPSALSMWRENEQELLELFKTLLPLSEQLTLKVQHINQIILKLRNLKLLQSDGVIVTDLQHMLCKTAITSYKDTSIKLVQLLHRYSAPELRMPPYYEYQGFARNSYCSNTRNGSCGLNMHNFRKFCYLFI